MKIGQWVGMVALAVALVILWQIRSALMFVLQPLY